MNLALGRLVKGAIFSAALWSMTIQPAQAQLTPAQQQAVDTQTGIASPGREEGRFLGEEFTPRIEPRVDVRKFQVQGMIPGADKIKFELNDIRLDGVTVYPQSALRPLYQDRLGLTISLADLYVIAAEMTRKYRNDGYILTQVVVPAQTIDGGIAALRVVEGYIGNIDVRGSGTEAEMRLIRDYAAQIKTGGALNTEDLERGLLLINDLPGVSARGVLNPSPAQVGAADLLIIVEHKSYDAQIGIDNFGTRYLGPVQLSAAGSLNSWFGQNERISAQFVTAPDDENAELVYGALSYDQPIGPYGTVFSLFGSKTVTNPGFDLKQFDVRGWSTNLNVGFSHPFVRTRAFNLTGNVEFDYRDVTTKNNIPIDPTRKDRIRTLRVGGTVEAIDNVVGLAYNVLDVELSKGLGILGANGSNTQILSRPAADQKFVKVNAEWQRLQRLSPEVNLLIGVKGQISSDALLSGEEFGIGGSEYGRGFDSSEAIGDDGVAGKFELQVNKPFDVALFENYQLYGFYDVGRVWNSDATTAATRRNTLTSAGLGLRGDLTSSAGAGLMLAFPLNKAPQTGSDKQPRLYFNLNQRF